MLLAVYYCFQACVNEDPEDVIWRQDQRVRTIFLGNEAA